MPVVLEWGDSMGPEWSRGGKETGREGRLTMEVCIIKVTIEDKPHWPPEKHTGGSLRTVHVRDSVQVYWPRLLSAISWELRLAFLISRLNFHSWNPLLDLMLVIPSRHKNLWIFLTDRCFCYKVKSVLLKTKNQFCEGGCEY